jgi:hypothetical protein
MDLGLVAPPLELLVDHRVFVAAQIAGISLAELDFVDVLSTSPVFGRIFLDFLGYERKFMNNLESLIEMLRTVASNQQVLALALIPPLERVFKVHVPFLSRIEEIARIHDDVFDRDFIRVLAEQTDQIFPAHREYILRWLPMENLVNSFTSNTAPRPDGILPVRCFRLPVDWQIHSARVADRIIKESPDKMGKILLDSLSDFSKNCRDMLHSIDSIPKLEQISRQFLIEPFRIVVSGRRFLREGKAKKQCRKGLSKRVLLLFSDAFMYAQCKGGKYMVPASYPLIRLRVGAAFYNDQPCLDVFAPRKSFILYFAQISDRDGWKAELESAIKNAKAHTIVPPYREAPIWIPDAVSNECMKCKISFGVFNRKHHCRNCGLIMCHKCLSCKIIMKDISRKRPSKVCADCFEALKASAAAGDGDEEVSEQVSDDVISESWNSSTTEHN